MYNFNQKIVNLKNWFSDNSDYVTTLESAKIILGDCDLLSQNVHHISKAKWVQSTWAGVDAALNAFRQNNASFIFTRYSDKLFGRAMSEYVVAQIYNHERDQRQQYVNQSQSTWNESGKIKNHRLIQDLTIGILGLGNIGMQSKAQFHIFKSNNNWKNVFNFFLGFSCGDFENIRSSNLGFEKNDSRRQI